MERLPCRRMVSDTDRITKMLDWRTFLTFAALVLGFFFGYLWGREREE